MAEMIAIFDWHDWLPLFPVYFEQTIKAIAEMSLAGFNFVRQQRDWRVKDLSAPPQVKI